MMYSHLDAKRPSLNVCNHRNSVAHSQQTLNKDTRFSDQPAEHTVIGDINVKRHPKTTDQIDSEAKQMDSKKYMVPVQTITKLISPLPDEKSSMTSGQCSEMAIETLILQKSNCSLNSSGVLKVTAKSMIDITDESSYSSQLYSNLLMKDLRPVKSENHIRNTTDVNSIKRSCSQYFINVLFVHL